MRSLLPALLLFLFSGSLVNGQFKSDLPDVDIPAAILNNNSAPGQFLIDPTRFHMNHGFSMSLMSINGQAISVGAYTNQMIFDLRDNLSVMTQFSLVQPGLLAGNNTLQNNQVFYQASLKYSPWSNTHLYFNFSNYPFYYQRANSTLLPLE